MILQEVKERIEDLEVEHDMILGSELENHRGISPSNLIGASFEKAVKFINPTLKNLFETFLCSFRGHVNLLFSYLS